MDMMPVNIIAVRDERAEADIAKLQESCEKHGHPWVMCYSILAPRIPDRSISCTIGHMLALSNIYTSGKPGIVVEHDCIINKPIDFPVEENTLYNLHGTRAGFGQLMGPDVAEQLLNHAFDINLSHPMCDIYWAQRAKSAPVCKTKFRIEDKAGYTSGNTSGISIRLGQKVRIG